MRRPPRAPRTAFSTELRGGSRAVKTRLGNLFSAASSRAPLLVAAALVLTVLAGGLVACNQSAPSPGGTPSAVFESVPAEAVDYALDLIDAQVRREPDFFTGGEPLSLIHSRSFDDILTGAVLEIYALDYRLETPKTRADFAGGAWLDGDGWYHDGWQTYLILENRAGERAPLGSYVEIDGIWHDGGWYGMLGELLVSRGGERGDAAMVLDGRRAFFRAYLDRAGAAMACLTGEAPSHGVPFTDESGHTWLKFADYQDSGLPRLDDGILQDLAVIFPRALAAELFQKYVYVGDPVIRQFEDGLYFREDSGEMLGWDYTIDLSTLTVTKWDEEIRQGYAQGIRQGGDFRWYFTLVNDGGWTFYQYYGLSAQGAEASDFSFSIDGAWHAMGTAEAFLFGTPYATTATDPDENGIYYATEWYGKDGGTGATFCFNPSRGVMALRSVAARDFEGFATWRGVRLGDSMEAVRAAYPDGAPYTDSANMDEKPHYQLFLTMFAGPDASDFDDSVWQMSLTFYDYDNDALVDEIVISDSRQ